jgi:hypothetical protein
MELIDAVWGRAARRVRCKAREARARDASRFVPSERMDALMVSLS